MKERPILFSAPMIRALLAGTKTQTRRVVKPQPHSHPAMRAEPRGEARWIFMAYSDRPDYQFLRCPFGAEGDRLWVREAWQAIHVFVDPETGCGDGLEYSTTVPTSDRDGWWTPVYAATDPQSDEHRDDRGFPWRPSIFMPRWASRITLEVTGVRVERLQEITEDDAQAEGISEVDGKRGVFDGGGPAMGLSARIAFMRGWDTINGKAGRNWADNPWCWVVSFRRVQP